MGSFKVSIMVIIMVRKILTKNSFKSGNGLVISPLLRDFFFIIVKSLIIFALDFYQFVNRVPELYPPKLNSCLASSDFAL